MDFCHVPCNLWSHWEGSVLLYRWLACSLLLLPPSSKANHGYCIHSEYCDLFVEGSQEVAFIACTKPMHICTQWGPRAARRCGPCPSLTQKLSPIDYHLQMKNYLLPREFHGRSSSEGRLHLLYALAGQRVENKLSGTFEISPPPSLSHNVVSRIFYCFGFIYIIFLFYLIGSLHIYYGS